MFSAHHHSRPHAQLNPHGSIKIPHKAFLNKRNGLHLFTSYYTSTQCKAKSVFTFLTRSWSSMSPRSLPAACAILFPATKLPTMMEAGPTPTIKHTKHHISFRFSPPNFRVPSPVKKLLKNLHLSPACTLGLNHFRILSNCDFFQQYCFEI